MKIPVANQQFLLGIIGCIITVALTVHHTTAQVRDSILEVDTIKLDASPSFFESFVIPDPGRPDLFLDSVWSYIVFEGGNFLAWTSDRSELLRNQDVVVERRASKPKPKRLPWIIFTLGGLFLAFGVLRVLFPSDVYLVIRGYFNPSLMAQINKEGRLFASWTFLILLVICGLSGGLFTALALNMGDDGEMFSIRFTYFGLVSLVILVLFIVKIGVLRLLGFLFDISKRIRNYANTLILGFCNTGIILFVAALLLSLLPEQYAGSIVRGSLILAGSFLLFRVIQTASDLVENYRFPKFYLFVYLCTLEIAPVLILLKVLFEN